MKRLVSKYGGAALSLLFGLSALLFWAVPYAPALSYQEQLQLFLFDSGYFVARLSVPGGLADYMAEFIVQFCFVPVFGAVLVALLYVLIQLVVWRLMKRFGAAGGWPSYLFSFAPSLLLWCHMGDESVLLSFGVALLAALLAAWARFGLRGFWGVAYEMVATIGLYWLFGPVVFVFVALVAAAALQRCKERGHVLPALGRTALLAVVSASWILLLASFLQYPLYRLFGGINYYRYPASVPLMQWGVMVFFALWPVACSCVKGRWFAWAAVLLTLLLPAGLWYCYDAAKYELIAYDYLVRNEQWDRIIAKAEHRQPSGPLSVSCVNLALSQKGQLADRLFDFYQNGAEGLFPAFSRDMTSPVPTAEIFFRLGMVNDALRYLFEAQQAIPNFRMSGRLTARIAQCEIVNGQYAVARKYLRTLQKSLFYSAWAGRTLRLLESEKAVEAHPLYGRLRRLRQQKHDFLFSDREMDQMLGLLFAQNHKNKMAYEYLMCYELLQKDLERFMQYYPLGQYAGYDHIPRAFQEVLIGVWLQKHADLRSIPYSVEAQTVENTVGFIRTYMAGSNDPGLNQPPYSTNAWHYLMTGRGSRKEKEKMDAIY